MKPGAPGQRDLKRALVLLDDVEKIVSNARLNVSHKSVQDLGNGLSTAKGALSEMLGAAAAEENPPAQPQRSMDPMKVALRVLTEIADRGQPHPDDLAALARICGRKPDGIGWDEFACEALQKVLGNRAAARQLLTGA